MGLGLSNQAMIDQPGHCASDPAIVRAAAIPSFKTLSNFLVGHTYRAIVVTVEATQDLGKHGSLERIECQVSRRVCHCVWEAAKCRATSVCAMIGALPTLSHAPAPERRQQR
jgi:hypothetical protein